MIYEQNPAIKELKKNESKSKKKFKLKNLTFCNYYSVFVTIGMLLAIFMRS